MATWTSSSYFQVPSYTSVLLISIILIFCVVFTGAVHRLYFSPIAGFPGPKLAALSLWQENLLFLTDLEYELILCSRYEFYYDVICHGQFVWHMRDLHERYGPIIRINPYELHISEPTFYEQLYASSASGEKRDKWAWYTKQFDSAGASFSTVEHGHHRVRRAALNKFFGKASVRRLQPIIDERIQCLVDRIRGFGQAKEEVMNISLAFAAYTNGKFW